MNKDEKNSTNTKIEPNPNKTNTINELGIIKIIEFNKIKR